MPIWILCDIVQYFTPAYATATLTMELQDDYGLGEYDLRTLRSSADDDSTTKPIYAYENATASDTSRPLYDIPQGADNYGTVQLHEFRQL